MADVLKPELLWIEGRCYRVNDAATSATEMSTLQEHDLYENETSYNDNEREDDEDDFVVTALDESRYSTSLHVSKHYVGYIIGKKGATKMRLESETKTNIKIPKHTEAGDICITGPTAASVKTARRRINLIVLSSRTKQKLTHFISLPMNTSEIKQNFQSFKDQILNEMACNGVEESVFIRAERLHLTLGVMCLTDNEEMMKASSLLSEAKEKIIMPLLRNSSPLRIRVKGLSYMNDDPTQIHVLYAQVLQESGEPGVLQSLVDQLVDYYIKAGYMDREHNRDNAKLHVTLINSKYRKTQDTRAKRRAFDGSEILQKFADIDFGVVELTELQLSQIGTEGSDGYYLPTCIISCRSIA